MSELLSVLFVLQDSLERLGVNLFVIVGFEPVALVVALVVHFDDAGVRICVQILQCLLF